MNFASASSRERGSHDGFGEEIVEPGGWVDDSSSDPLPPPAQVTALVVLAACALRAAAVRTTRCVVCRALGRPHRAIAWQLVSPLGRASSSRHELFLRKYVLQETIGQGAFGKVKRAKCRSTHEARAVKIIDKKLIGDIDDVLRYTREFAILNSLNHKNIIHLQEVQQNDRFFYIVMDLCAGNLHDLIAEKGAFPPGHDKHADTRRNCGSTREGEDPDAGAAAGEACGKMAVAEHEQRKVLDEAMARGYFRQLVAGVEHAHKKLVIRVTIISLLRGGREGGVAAATSRDTITQHI